MVVAAVTELIPTFRAPENRVLAVLVASDAGQAFLDGAWGWYALLLAMFLFNTVLGEELLFRGYLLPRMNGAFGRGDWVVNGPALYRLPPTRAVGYAGNAHWVVPSRLPDIAIPERLDRDRGAQLPERVLCDRITPDRPLRQHRCCLDQYVTPLECRVS